MIPPMQALLEPDAEQALQEALAEMERRTEARRRVQEHLDTCQECDEVLCYVGAALVRDAVA